MYPVYNRVDGIPDSIQSFPKRPAEQSVLLVHPQYYEVVYEINPHMTGKIGTVDKIRALSQWNHLKGVYESLGYPVHVLDGASNLPDMVFCANQTFPFIDGEGQRAVVLSNMASEFRQGEVPLIADWYRKEGYRVIEQTIPPVDFEGMGDALWHPNRKLLYIGYGFRTRKEALKRAATCMNSAVVGLELVQPHFYHLDTALSIIDEQTAIYIPDAFAEKSREVLRHLFPRLLEVPLSEAKDGFVTNGHCPDGKHFIVNTGNPITKQKIEDLGIRVIEVDTSEFLKSGGSVFCMKMMLP